MKFSICMIAKNEANTLPRFINSPKTKEFLARGGEVCLLDTGSTDSTVKLAKDAGFVVKEVHSKHIHHLSDADVSAINKLFVVEDDMPVVKKGQKYFNFSDARNEVASMAKNDMVSFVDCDEEFTVLDFDKINSLIEQGFEQFEYKFVFAHDAFGKEAISFTQSKMYDRRKVKWVNYVHEVLSGPAKLVQLDESIFKLEHFQMPSNHRSNYLPGLAIDCYRHLNYDRNSHYFAREMMYAGRFKSAIKEFKRHISLKGWPLEAAQSMIFIGDCYGYLNKPDDQTEWYHKSFHFDSNRREALLKLAGFYRHNDNFKATAAYAAAALEIPYVSYYANDMSHYANYPHELLYWAYGWMGNIPKAQEHILKALEFQPYNSTYLRDTKYYFEYGSPDIEGWMLFKELQWLYNTSKKYHTIAEIGSWKGRSTHALLSGKAQVTAIDTWQGSDFELDSTHDLAKFEDVFEVFKKNTSDFSNLTINKNRSLDAAKGYADNTFDVVFIDAGHRYEDVLADIKAWLPKAKKIICGHDYMPNTWQGVIQAVDEVFGKPDEVHDTIWVKYLDKPITNIQKFTDMIRNSENFSYVKLGDGEIQCMLGVVGQTFDQHPYSPELAVALTDAYNFLNTLSTAYVNGWDEAWVPGLKSPVTTKGNMAGNEFIHNDISSEKFDFYKTLKHSPRKKVFIGPARLQEVETFLNIDEVIEIPEINCFTYNFDIEPETNAIYLFCGGMAAKTWIASLLKKNANITCLDMGSAFDPILYKQTRTGQLSTDELRDHYKELLYDVSIPKKIFTIWLSTDKEIPPLIKHCIDSQKIDGYEHKLITLDNCFKDSDYMQQFLSVPDSQKIWTKASDYLRAYYLYHEGGIYLDADVEILQGKNFDALLHNSMFVAKEVNGFLGSAVIGARKGYPFIKQWMDAMTSEFRGDDDKCFESSMELLTKGYYERNWYKTEFKVLTDDYFYPYDHASNNVNITNNTITYHYFAKTWVKDKENLPLVSIILPTLGRKEGLERCLKSIEKLNYPKDRIETIVIEDKPRLGVPRRVWEGYQKATGDIICFAANDIEFTPNSLLIAVNDYIKTGKRLIAFDTGVRNEFGYICEHFIIHRSLVEQLGEIFSFKLKHFAADTLLWDKASKLGDAYQSKGFVHHYHYSRIGSGIEMDDINKLVLGDVDSDRAIYTKELKKLGV